ncbi:MAG TPA: type IV toxin-antitoxin system AbiEi family antitoxin domain-containing protein, partial [Solirubrobacterales bacterium]
MVCTTARTPKGQHESAWSLARKQHGVVSRPQLMALGLTRRGIQHRIARGRLHPVGRGIYAVGRPELTQHGQWMAAILACGGVGKAALSHSSAAALFKIGVEQAAAIEVTRLSPGPARIPGVKVHRRPALKDGWYGLCEGIPVTSPVQTLVDLATRHGRSTMERATNEADKLGLVRTDDLRKALDEHAGEPGVARLRLILDRPTFRYTRTELERAFIPLARQAGLSLPRTSVYVTGHEVDFHFDELGLVVETDGLTYHRTPAQQAKDRVRDQDHSAAG